MSSGGVHEEEPRPDGDPRRLDAVVLRERLEQRGGSQAGRGQRPDRAAQLAHRRRRLDAAPDDVAEQLRTRVLDPGVDGVLLNLVPNGHLPGTVQLAARAASAALAG